VKTHPEASRKTLSLSIGLHAHAIPQLSDVESGALLDELLDFTCQLPRIYHHSWTPSDVVLRDNSCPMRQACPRDMRQPRIIFHSRLAGDSGSEWVAVAA
jgi:alpha-ketoglutarate-dependent taurine dioxygenase